MRTRVCALSHAACVEGVVPITNTVVDEADLTLIGYIVFLDPPKAQGCCSGTFTSPRLMKRYCIRCFGRQRE
jgi:hypothetical protein